MEPTSTVCEEQCIENEHVLKMTRSSNTGRSLDWDWSFDQPEPAVNPKQAPHFDDTGQIPARHVFCSNYDLCLDVAIAQLWDSFTCDECCNFELSEYDSVQWLDDSSRCWQLIEALKE